MVLVCKALSPLHSRVHYAMFGWNCHQKKIFKLDKCISTILIFHLEKEIVLYLNKLDSPSPKDALCQVYLKLALWFWRRRFLYFVNVFLLFLIYLPLEKGVVLHLNTFEFPSLKDALCQVWLNLALWFRRKGFLIFFSVFSLFRNYHPLEKGVVLHLNIFEFLPPIKDAVCQVWLTLTQWFRSSEYQNKKGL